MRGGESVSRGEPRRGGNSRRDNETKSQGEERRGEERRGEETTRRGDTVMRAIGKKAEEVPEGFKLHCQMKNIFETHPTFNSGAFLIPWLQHLI